MVTSPDRALLELVMALERAAIAHKLLGTTRAHWDLDSCKLLMGLQGKAIALMALGQHAHCTARMACGMCEQHMFRYGP